MYFKFSKITKITQKNQEQIVIWIIIGIIVWAIFSWAISPSAPASFDEEPCIPDYIG